MIDEEIHRRSFERDVWRHRRKAGYMLTIPGDSLSDRLRASGALQTARWRISNEGLYRLDLCALFINGKERHAIEQSIIRFGTRGLLFTKDQVAVAEGRLLAMQAHYMKHPELLRKNQTWIG